MAKSNMPINTIEQIGQAVVAALAEWGLVEISLAHLFVALMDDGSEMEENTLKPWGDVPLSRRKAHSIMDAVVSLETRLALISAVIIEELLLNDEGQVIWGMLKARIMKKYKGRHQIAHFIIDRDQRTDSEQTYLWPLATVLLGPDAPRIGPTEIAGKEAAFKELRLALGYFIQQLEHAKGRFLGPPVPETALIARLRATLSRASPQAS